MARMLLHGVIDAKIVEADLSVTSDGQLRPSRKTLMKRKVFSWIKKKLPFCNSCQTQQVENAVGLGPLSGMLYATVDIDKARVGRTRMVEPTGKPQWKESFHIYCAHDAGDVIFTVKADNTVGATLIGRAYLPVDSGIAAGVPVSDLWLPICDDNRRPLDGGDKIRVQLRFTDVAADPTARWGAGVGSAAYQGVPRTFFPQRRGCRVRLYQDAHIADGFAPRIQLAGRRRYEPRRCWEDVFDAINNARRMVYVAGWSVNTDVALVRRTSSSETLGELLKRKAEQGVTVLLLVWNDRTSVGLGPIRRDGLMATHDEDTARYFERSKVHCVLCPRNPDQGRSYVQDVETATMFTHHQKTVIVDGGGSGNTAPGLVSFLGGIDLCDGRYDTQEHPLFRTLDTTHHSDFHQPNFPGASIAKGGPREPWHDIHCRVEGPAAWDVLDNFEQRWRKQAGEGKDNLLVTLDRSMAAREATQNDPEYWNVQVFRSIDGGAAAGFPENPDDAAAAGLVSGKDHVIERSIQDAYIHAIRRARDFIYIENQYFLGSSYAWRSGEGVTKVEEINALHLIPRELSLKIASKIDAGERFAVYVVVPMWPEGVPESDSVQAILDWQRRTMEMMYRDVAVAIQAKGIRADPTDYLNFFCLGNRERAVPGGDKYKPPEHPDPDTDYMRAQNARRFMIYVHAKTMIVDDEYIIVGSANINQRSMDGGRDTEIAMGAYQPNYLASGNRPARGQVHGFRLALWHEHLGRSVSAAGGAVGDLLRPSSLACVKLVSQAAKRHWEAFASGDYAPPREDLPGHLMAYPVSWTGGGGNDGKLVGVTEMFPDTKAKVLGAKSAVLPPILTT
uniref:Phospholipase D n=1 Tax=Oryza punctata TaxID=4537 RepID=A0A0E0KEK6_ORYPU